MRTKNLFIIALLVCMSTFLSRTAFSLPGIEKTEIKAKDCRISTSVIAQEVLVKPAFILDFNSGVKSETSFLTTKAKLSPQERVFLTAEKVPDINRYLGIIKQSNIKRANLVESDINRIHRKNPDQFSRKYCHCIKKYSIRQNC